MSVDVVIDNKLIYDSDCYSRPGYRVVAVEGNPQLAGRLRERFKAKTESGAYILIAIPIFVACKALGDNTLFSRNLPRIPILRRLMTLASWYDTHARRE